MFNPKERKIRFKLLSGRHRCGEKVIKKGEIFEELLSKIKWMSHRVEVLNTPPPEPLRWVVTRLKKEHKGGGKYNVINMETESPINDRLLTSKEADDLVLENQTKKDETEDETEDEDQDAVE